MRSTSRDSTTDCASDYAKRARTKTALVSTSWHNMVLNASERTIEKHTAELIVRRRQLTLASSHGLDDSRWLQEVERFIDAVIDESAGHVRSSPERLRAVRWMIAGATAQYASSSALISSVDEGALVADAA